MAGGAVAGILIGQNIAATQKGIEAARTSWKALEAQGFTLAFEPTTGFAVAIGKERPTLTGKKGATAIDVRVKTDMVHFAWTEVVGHRKAPFDGVVGVHPSPGGVLGYLRSWLGQDIEVGDAAFDMAYLVTGKPEAAAPALLVPSVRELVAALGRKLAAFTCEGDAARVVLVGVETDLEVLRVAMDLAAAGAAWAP